MALTASRVDDGSFRISGDDLTGLFPCGRRVILNLSGTYVVSTVWKVSYSSPYTTVAIEEEVVTSALIAVEFGIGIGPTKQFPNHCHSLTEGDGGVMEAPFQFSWIDADEIKIHPGAKMLYSSDGAVDRVMYNDTELTFQFGSGGSNSDSDDLVADDIFYLYLDESVCKAQRSRELTAGCFVAKTTEPTKNNFKRQWLNGNDRCIFGINTDTSGNIREFVQHNNLVTYLDRTHGSTSAAWDVWQLAMGITWTTISFNFPVFVRVIHAGVVGHTSGTTTQTYTRPSGTGLGCSLQYSLVGDFPMTPQKIHVDANQDAEFVSTDASAQLWAIADSFFLHPWI